MGWVIALTADGPDKLPPKKWAEMQADANCRAPSGPPKWVEEYAAARMLGLPPDEAWEVMRKKMAEGNGR